VNTTPDKKPERVPDDLVNAFFDRALDEGSREKFFGMLRADLSRCAEVAKTQRMISMLREPVETPDLTDRIMMRVAAKRGFVPESLRRWVTRGRVAAAACVLLGVLGLAVAKRMSPDSFRLAPAERPLSSVIESGRADAASGVQQMAAAVTMRAAPSARAPRGVLGPLTPGKTSVKTLAHGDGALALPSGAGDGARFVFEGGRCVDRHTLVSVPLGSFPVVGGACPDALEQFIRSMAEGVAASAGSVSGSSAAGTSETGRAAHQ
jgi:hypothetical protein